MGCWFNWYAISKQSFLLFVIDIFSKYEWAIPLKDNQGVTVASGFLKILETKPNKTLVDSGSEFYNRCMKSWVGKEW